MFAVLSKVGQCEFYEGIEGARYGVQHEGLILGIKDYNIWACVLNAKSGSTSDHIRIYEAGVKIRHEEREEQHDKDFRYKRMYRTHSTCRKRK